MQRHRNTVALVDAAAARGLELDVRHFPEGTRSAIDAAAAIGVDVAQIVKSLVFTMAGGAVVALVSGANRLAEAKLAAALGVPTSRVQRAGADMVRAATGYPIGGVPPFGHLSELPTFVDRDLLAFDVVWAAAGTPDTVFPIAPDDLVRAAQATVTDLAVT